MPPRLPRWSSPINGSRFIPPRSPLFLDVFLPWAARASRPPQRGVFGDALGYYLRKDPAKARVEPRDKASAERQQAGEGEASEPRSMSGTDEDRERESAESQERRNGSYLDPSTGRIVFGEFRGPRNQLYEDISDAKRRRRRDLARQLSHCLIAQADLPQYTIYRKDWRQRLEDQRLKLAAQSSDEAAAKDARHDAGVHPVMLNARGRSTRHHRQPLWFSRAGTTDQTAKPHQAVGDTPGQNDGGSSKYRDLRHVYVKTASAEQDFYLPSYRSQTDYRLRLPIRSTMSIPTRRYISSFSTPDDTSIIPISSEIVRAADMVHTILRRSSSPNASDLGRAVLAHPLLRTPDFLSAAQEQFNRMANAWHGNSLQNCLSTLRLGPLADGSRALRHITSRDRALPWALRCWPPRPDVMDPLDPDELLCRYHFRLLRLSPENASSLDCVADLRDIKTACQADNKLRFVSLRAYMNLTIAYWERLRLSDDPWAPVQLIESFLGESPGLHPDAWTLDLLARALFHRPNRFSLEGEDLPTAKPQPLAAFPVPLTPELSASFAPRSDLSGSCEDTGPAIPISSKALEATVPSRGRHRPQFLPAFVDAESSTVSSPVHAPTKPSTSSTPQALGNMVSSRERQRPPHLPALVEPDLSFAPNPVRTAAVPSTPITHKAFEGMVSSREDHQPPHLLLPISSVQTWSKNTSPQAAALKQVFMIIHGFKHRHALTALNNTWLRLANQASAFGDVHQARIAWEGWWASWTEISTRPRTWVLKVKTTRGTKRVTTFRRSGTLFRKFHPCLRMYLERGWIEEKEEWEEGDELGDLWVWRGKEGQAAKKVRRDRRHQAYGAANLLRGLLEEDDWHHEEMSEGAIDEPTGIGAAPGGTIAESSGAVAKMDNASNEGDRATNGLILIPTAAVDQLPGFDPDAGYQ